MDILCVVVMGHARRQGESEGGVEGLLYRQRGVLSLDTDITPTRGLS